ncbi:MAG: YheC/YheD family protein, partial [Firmicutes bacterium]|nr:YheC/YheD family protein [Bacillota bacterium]
MTVIGFLHYRKKPTNKAYAYAAVAKAEGAELLYFSPGAVDFAQRKIDGYQYQSGAWAEVRSDFPDAICYFAKFSKARQQEVVQRLFR